MFHEGVLITLNIGPAASVGTFPPTWNSCGKVASEIKLELPPDGYPPPHNMQLVDSQYSVVWEKGWLVFVVVLVVLWCRCLVCNKYRIEEL